MGKSTSSTASTQQTSQADNRVVLGNDAAQIGAFGQYTRDAGNVSDSGNSSTSNLDLSDRSSRNSWLDASDRSSTSVSDSSQRNLSTSVTDASQRNLTDASQRNLTDASSRNFSTSDSSQRNLSTSVSDSSSRTSDSHNVTNYSTTDGGAVSIAAMNAQLLRGVSRDETEATKTIAKLGVDAITNTAQAATNLFATGSADASASWAHTIDKSSELIDHLLLTAKDTVSGAQGIAGAAIASYQPTANKASGDMSKAAIYAAGAVVLILLLKH